MKTLKASPYLTVTLATNARKSVSPALTQSKRIEGCLLTITPTKAAQDAITLDKSGLFSLFFNAITEIARNYVDANKITQNENQLMIHFSNDKTAIEGFTKNLRNAELDAYCNRNGIETSKGALISQTLRDLVLLTNALIQNTTISASKHIIASDSTKEFSPFVTRF